jgi:hypothetical protein
MNDYRIPLWSGITRTPNDYFEIQRKGETMTLSYGQYEEAYGFQNEEESVDMDEVSKNEDSDIEEDSDKEPESSLGEDSEIDEESDKEPDSELDE